MLQCFTPVGCLSPTQADCEVQLSDAASEQQNAKKTLRFYGKSDGRDSIPKRDQARPAAQATTPTTVGCCGRAVTWVPALNFGNTFCYVMI
jgi:hypothetical protein